MMEQQPQQSIEQKGSSGPFIAIIIILLVIVIGGIYFWDAQRADAPEEITEETQQGEFSDIEATLNTNEFDDIDAELEKIDAEFEAVAE